jgi:hypothetical protein
MAKTVLSRSPSWGRGSKGLGAAVAAGDPRALLVDDERIAGQQDPAAARLGVEDPEPVGAGGATLAVPGLGAGPLGAPREAAGDERDDGPAVDRAGGPGAGVLDAVAVGAAGGDRDSDGQAGRAPHPPVSR